MRKQSGQVLVLVLIYMLLGSILITPLLYFIRSNHIIQSKSVQSSDEYYTANAGVQDALWKIKYNHLDTLTPSYNDTDFNTQWTYDLANESQQVNKSTATVSIKNVWIPTISYASGGSGKLLVTGQIIGGITDSLPDAVNYQFRIVFYPSSGDKLYINDVALWLPNGFDYVGGSCNLEGVTGVNSCVQSNMQGGIKLYWKCKPILLTEMPNYEATSTEKSCTVSLKLTSKSSVAPSGVYPMAWVTTLGVSGVSYAWDSDVKVFCINSVSGNTSITAYTEENKSRHQPSAMYGDYKAIGNSLMIDTNHDTYGIRDKLLSSSNATITNLPTDAFVEKAYLYWSGWLNNGTKYDNACSFTVGSHNFNITAIDCQYRENLPSKPGTYSYSCFCDVSDIVRNSSDGHGNAVYTIGGVNGTIGDEWSYANWSLIIIYSSSQTLEHQIYLFDKFRYVNNNNDNNEPDFDGDGKKGGNISGFLVPMKVATETNAAEITCFVGEGDACYSGDSFKLNNSTLVDDNNDPINNVWNSKSLGASYDGIDIDTFKVSWSSGLLKQGDTSAKIDLPTQTDSWNLIYMVVSFRSLITTSGILNYNISSIP